MTDSTNSKIGDLERVLYYSEIIFKNIRIAKPNIMKRIASGMGKRLQITQNGNSNPTLFFFL